jgi:hypothetical protein
MSTVMVCGRSVLVPVLHILAILLCSEIVSGSDTEYQRGDSVPLFANKACFQSQQLLLNSFTYLYFFDQVGPFANPSEQYEYYTLPFCAPKVCISLGFAWSPDSV